MHVVTNVMNVKVLWMMENQDFSPVNKQQT